MLNKSLWKNNIVICITYDMDWTSEDAIKYNINILNEYGFKSTFFITHKSSIAIEKIKKNEIHGGIQPDFFKKSSQGRSIDEVIEYCTKLLPEANCFRSYKCFDNSDITEKLYQRGFKYDSNLNTNLEIVDPFIHSSRLIRFPIYFEDKSYLLNNYSLSFKDLERRILSKPGLYIFNINPMNMAINSPSYLYFQKIKDVVNGDIWSNLTQKELEHLEYHGRGIRNLIIELFNFIKKEDIETITLEEAYNSTISN